MLSEELIKKNLLNINKYFSRLFANLNEKSPKKISLEEFKSLRDTMHNCKDYALITWSHKGSGRYSLGFNGENITLGKTHSKAESSHFTLTDTKNYSDFNFVEILDFFKRNVSRFRDEIVSDFATITNTIIEIEEYKVPRFEIKITVEEEK